MLTFLPSFMHLRKLLRRCGPVLLVTVLLSAQAGAQDTTGYAAIDRQAMMLTTQQAPDFNRLIQWFRVNFSTEDSRARAVYTFIASHFSYDVANMLKWNAQETRQQKVAYFLRNGKGICEHYAYTFDSICRQLGLHSYMIGGITRQNGNVDSLPHAWCAVEVDGEWHLYDPTWGAGYIQDNVFVPHLNYTYYKIEPDIFVRSHLPFDPLWQFLDRPYTQEQFIQGRMDDDPARVSFSYRDTLREYEQQTMLQQVRGTLQRIDTQGLFHPQTATYTGNLRLQIHQLEQNELGNRYNLAVADYNRAVASFNRYIAAKNRQFRTVKTDSLLKDMVNKPLNTMQSAMDSLQAIAGADAALQKAMAALRQKLAVLSKRQREEADFVDRYLLQNKAGRQNMFFVNSVRRVPAKPSTR